jgi:phosphatidylinositol glycan class S
MPSLPVSLKDPSTLFYQSNAVKRSVIASYWIVIFLSVPLWWYTTSIQRLSLPRSRIYSHAQRPLIIPVDVCVEDDRIIPNLQDTLAAGVNNNPGHWGDIELRFHGQGDCR